jgi:Flp pilus assembly protein TadD
MAVSCLQARDYARTETMCRDVLQLQPGELNFLVLLASVLHITGRSDEALPLAEQVLQGAPQSAETQLLAGRILRSLNREDEAKAHLLEAVRLSPALADAHLQLGDIARRSLDYRAAESHLRKAKLHAPADFISRIALGDVLLQMERFAEAIDEYAQALELAPPAADMAGTRLNLGIALRRVGQCDAALAQLDRAPPNEALAAKLECLLELRRHEEFFAAIERNLPACRGNIAVAAISAYASQQLGRNDPHPFCPDPLSRVRILDHLGLGDARNAGHLITGLIEAYDSFTPIWEPASNATVGGYSTTGNVFDSMAPAIVALREALTREFIRFRSEVAPVGCWLSQDWPRDLRLHGWYVRLSSGGFEGPHIHPYGWASGVVYLKLPQTRPVDEGSIEFSLKAPGYPDLGAEQARRVHRPEVGQVVLFPSSLYHRTLPFTGRGEERISLAFDLCR